MPKLEKIPEYYLEEFRKLSDELLKCSLVLYDASAKEVVRTFTGFAENGIINDIGFYKKQTDLITGVIRDMGAFINTYNEEENALIVRSISNMGFLFDLFQILGGVNIRTTKYYLNDRYAYISLMTGKLVKVPGGLRDGMMENVPAFLVDMISDMVGPVFLYGGGLVYDDKLLGNIGVILKRRELRSDEADFLSIILRIFSFLEHIKRMPEK